MNPYGILPLPWCVDVCVWRVVFPSVYLSGSHFCGLCLPVFKIWHVKICLLLVHAYVYIFFLFFFSVCTFIQPACIHNFKCICNCVAAHACLFVFSLISSVPAGQFWHLRRSMLCVPHGTFLSSTELEMGLWYVEIIFLNATNLCFSLSPPFTVFLSLQPHPSPLELVNPPCCVRLMKDKKGPIPLTLSHGPSEDCTNLPGS